MEKNVRYDLVITEEEFEAWKGLPWAELNKVVWEKHGDPWLFSYGASVVDVRRDKKGRPVVAFLMYDSCD